MLVRGPIEMVARPASKVLLYQTLEEGAATIRPIMVAVPAMKTVSSIAEPVASATRGSAGSRRLLFFCAIACLRSATSVASSGRIGPGRAAGIEKARRHALVGEDRGARLERHVVLDDRPVEDDGAVLDGDIAADRAGMHAGILADGDAIADDAREDIVRDVQRGPGAEVEIVADLHDLTVGAQDAQGPEPRVATERDAAEHGRAHAGKDGRPGDVGRLAGVGENERGVGCHAVRVVFPAGLAMR